MSLAFWEMKTSRKITRYCSMFKIKLIRIIWRVFQWMKIIINFKHKHFKNVYNSIISKNEGFQPLNFQDFYWHFLEDRALHKETWVAKLLGTQLSIQVHKKVKFSGRDILFFAVKGLINCSFLFLQIVYCYLFLLKILDQQITTDDKRIEEGIQERETRFDHWLHNTNRESSVGSLRQSQWSETDAVRIETGQGVSPQTCSHAKRDWRCE